MRSTKAIAVSLLTLLLIWGLNRPWGGIPAFGSLISPFVGFWQNAESVNNEDENVTVSGTQAPVTVLFDDHAVPHVFAQNDHDMYFAQGFLTARDRLWQMEFQTHAAAGRVSEIVGDKALELDRFNRHLGMVYGAEQTLKGMESDAGTREALEAYTAGVNAWIKQLSPAQYPIEYKLLGYAPEPWTPLKCALLLKQMSSTLAGGADDLLMSNILKKYGKAITTDLFPDYPVHEDPIIPVGTQWDFKPLPIPAPPKDSLLGNLVALSAPGFGTPPNRANPEIGSNNWAVGPQKSASGHPILANDPHLTLSLPSIWYQIQLVSPTVNVYGASLPGAPNVIIGFNKNVAWGVTNVGADVLDFYAIKFRDASRQEYWHNNQWKAVRRRIETIKVKGQPDVIDTVYYTHHGPLVYEPKAKPFRPSIPVGYAARWIAHEPSNEMRCFYLLNRAKNFTEYRKALAYYVAPAQNFIFADNENDIAISPNGRFPLKWKDQGKFLLDGTDPVNDWHGFIPADQNPLVKNPPRGFVSSANQFSTDPTYPYYINWQFAPYERGHRINQRLTTMQRATTDSLRQLQNDTYNIRAADALPVILAKLSEQGFTQDQQKALQILRKWKRNNDAGEVGPTIFTEWMAQFMKAVWADEFDGEDTIPMRFPTFDRTLTLMQRDTGSRWFDNVGTPTREHLPDLLRQSFQSTCDTLTKKHGTLGMNWAWGPHKGTDIRHLLPGVDAFSVLDLNVGGGNVIVNATNERSGPSWRMVVALGDQPKAYGVYPGGQSGNPGSPYYLDMLDTWRTGQLNELLYLQTAADKHPRIKRKMTLK
ncbi:penicillin acylase family protein [Spirosoma sp. KNUC1025]|uniref:penicillin acylase family protein n=1 Tax=Spirosoma sp. KNUC1025 TaxID=2894082 RepID=UPI003867F87A|nr:penicillin acylase family protein [Spirosoma sp. KNUC1025]